MKHNDSKELSRAKRFYKSNPVTYINVLEKVSRKVYASAIKRCESITEFLSSRYAKMLKKTTVPFRSKMGQIEQHHTIKKSRAEARKQILEGIQEFDERYDEYFETEEW